MVIWYILWPFGIFYGHLVYFMAIGVLYGHLVFFHRFGMVYQEVSGNPDLVTLFFGRRKRMRLR
jgi:hypothetical protein